MVGEGGRSESKKRASQHIKRESALFEASNVVRKSTRSGVSFLLELRENWQCDSGMNRADTLGDVVVVRKAARLSLSLFNYKVRTREFPRHFSPEEGRNETRSVAPLLTRSSFLSHKMKKRE